MCVKLTQGWYKQCVCFKDPSGRTLLVYWKSKTLPQSSALAIPARLPTCWRVTALIMTNVEAPDIGTEVYYYSSTSVSDFQPEALAIL